MESISLLRLLRHARWIHTHKKFGASGALNTAKPRRKRPPPKSRSQGALRPLWAPFREVPPEQDDSAVPTIASEDVDDVTDCGDGGGGGAAARFWGVAPADAVTRVADTVTPLWRLSYPRQLEVKQARVRALLRQLQRAIYQQGGAAPVAAHRHRPCILDDIVPSPVTEGYRNKDEFVIGEGVDGDARTVGFLVGSRAEGPPLCLPPQGVRALKPAHLRVAEAFQSFVRSSPLSPCTSLDDGGHWRTLLVRSDRQGALMAAATLHPRDLTRQQVAHEADRLQQFFQSGEGAQCRLQSLLLQQCRHVRCTAEQAAFQSLFGPGQLQDELSGVRLSVAPDAFLQTNMAAAEKLYECVEQQARLSPASVLLDLCSGTGVIGLLLSRHCRAVIGVEQVTGAVSNARHNACANHIQNVEFVTGRVDKVLPAICADLELASDVVAVLNAGRAGVAGRVVKQLRAAASLRRLLYIACKPEHVQVTANLTALCRPGDGAFQLTRATPVDMFPHTDHVELLLTLER